MNKVNISLTSEQVDLLRGVLFEYYLTHNYHDQRESDIHAQLEIILANAENSFSN